MENSETICLASSERFWGWEKAPRGKGQEEVDGGMETLTSSKGEPIRVKPLLLSAATNIICNVMFGARFVGLL